MLPVFKSVTTNRNLAEKCEENKATHLATYYADLYLAVLVQYPWCRPIGAGLHLSRLVRSEQVSLSLAL